MQTFGIVCIKWCSPKQGIPRANASIALAIDQKCCSTEQPKVTRHAVTSVYIPCFGLHHFIQTIPKVCIIKTNLYNPMIITQVKLTIVTCVKTHRSDAPMLNNAQVELTIVACVKRTGLMRKCYKNAQVELAIVACVKRTGDDFT
jgi:hypothetical protein